MKSIKECGNCRHCSQESCCTHEDWINGPFKEYLALLADMIGHVESITVGPHFSCPKHEELKCPTQ